MNTPIRYIRAFIIALKMTLRGEKPPPPPYPELRDWARQMALLVDGIYSAADASGLKQAERKAVIIRLDGRSMNLEMILGTLRYHAAEEYPSLLRATGRFNRGAIHATNMNDLYWLSRLREAAALGDAAVQAALERLDEHLQNIPK